MFWMNHVASSRSFYIFISFQYIGYLTSTLLKLHCLFPLPCGFYKIKPSPVSSCRCFVHLTLIVRPPIIHSTSQIPSSKAILVFLSACIQQPYCSIVNSAGCDSIGKSVRSWEVSGKREAMLRTTSGLCWRRWKEREKIEMTKIQADRQADAKVKEIEIEIEWMIEWMPTDGHLSLSLSSQSAASSLSIYQLSIVKSSLLFQSRFSIVLAPQTRNYFTFPRALWQLSRAMIEQWIEESSEKKVRGLTPKRPEWQKKWCETKWVWSSKGCRLGLQQELE